MIGMADGPVANLPPNLPAYAGYVDESGIGETWPTLLSRTPGKLHLSITTKPGFKAMCADVETGAMTVQEARGYWCLYCSVANVEENIDALGYVPQRLFTAHTGEGAHLCGPRTCMYPGLTHVADATQYAQNLPPGYDLSLLSDSFFATRPADPSPPPRSIVAVYPTFPAQGVRMASLIARIPVGSNGQGWAVFDGGINSDPGSASLVPAIPWAQFVSATPWCDDPAHDLPNTGTPLIGVQERNGYLFVKAQSAIPGDSVVAYIVY